MKKLLYLYLIFFSFTLSQELPNGFVYIKDIIPDIELELRYVSNDNFIGKKIDGYERPVGILTKKAALKLKEVQDELSEFGMGLKIFDAYRPQMAVDYFVRWAKDLSDTLQKQKYYPTVDKKDLFKDGYIAERSSHSRGSTVDLTIIFKDSKKEIDMGSGFDFFSPISWANSSMITNQQRANRLLLKLIMEKHGFKPYSKEWWHFTLKDEPFSDKYFNFPIK